MKEFQIISIIEYITKKVCNVVLVTPYCALICLQTTDLLVNITKHVLKPKHRVLTDQEKKKLLKKYSLNEKQVCLQT